LVGKRKDHSEDLGVSGKIILEWILEKWRGKLWTGFAWLRRDQWWDLVITIMNLQVPFGREFLEQLNEC